MSPTEAPDSVVKPRKEVIVIVDDNERFRSSCRRWLKTKGFLNVKCTADSDEAIETVSTLKPDVVLIDIHLGQENDGLLLLGTLRALGFRGLGVVISGDSSKEQCFRAAKAGANDFLLKRPNVNIAEEVVRLLRRSKDGELCLGAASLSELGYLRSFGLTRREIEILEEFAKDYNSQKIIADRLDTAPVQLRKAFGRIYKKLDIEGLGQLIHILTVCSMFHSKG